MGDTIEDMDKEIEQKGTGTEFLENKIWLPDSEVKKENKRLGLNKITLEKT